MSVSSLPIAGGTLNNWTGTLDIGNNGLVIQYGGGTDPYSTIANMIHSSYANGAMDRHGNHQQHRSGRGAARSPTPGGAEYRAD